MKYSTTLRKFSSNRSLYIYGYSHRVKTDVFKKYAIDNPRQIPDICRFEPVALVLGMRPGNVCEVTRNSRTAINAKHYRICSP